MITDFIRQNILVQFLRSVDAELVGSQIHNHQCFIINNSNTNNATAVDGNDGHFVAVRRRSAKKGLGSNRLTECGLQKRCRVSSLISSLLILLVSIVVAFSLLDNCSATANPSNLSVRFVNAVVRPKNRTNTSSVTHSDTMTHSNTVSRSRMTLSNALTTASLSSSATISGSGTGTMSGSVSVTPSRTRGSFSSSVSITSTQTLSVTKNPQRTRTQTFSSTQSASASHSASVSFTTSGTLSGTATLTNSMKVSGSLTGVSKSATPRIRTPPVTDSETRTLSQTASASISLSVTVPTISTSLSGQLTSTNQLTPTATEVLTDTFSFTDSLRVSASRTFTTSQTDYGSYTRTKEPPKTVTLSVTERITFTPTFSNSFLPTPTKSHLDTETLTTTASLRESVTLSAQLTSTVSQSFTGTITHSVPISVSKTLLVTPSQTASVSILPSNTRSVPLTDTVTTTLSQTASPSASISSTLTVTESAGTRTHSLTIMPTPSNTVSVTGSSSISPPITETMSMSATISLSSSVSQTGGSPSQTYSPPPTRTESDTVPPTGSNPITGTKGTFSATSSVSVTYSLSASSTPSQSLSSSLSATQTQSATTSLTQTLSLSQSGTLSNSQTSSVSVTISATASATCSITFSASKATQTMSLSLPPTTSVIPPTTTLLPTPSRTLPTSCPDDCMNGQCMRDPRWTFVHFCACYQNPTRGYWGGSEFGGPCDRCSFGYYGPKCVDVCPGGTCAICSAHGTCFDGVMGSGTCKCFDDDVRGHWTGISCMQCLPGYYGSKCIDACECKVGKSVCADGRSGNGGCSCTAPGWYGSYCSLCYPEIAGPECNVECAKNELGQECSGNGTCVRSGRLPECNCYPTYGGSACDKRCPGTVAMNATHQCSGHGVCNDGRLGTATCTCRGNFAQPACASCLTGYFGADCDRVCPGGVDNPCSGRGECLQATGVCRCSGVYGGDVCTLTCPLNSTGAVCSGHGKCVGSDAHCECDRSPQTGYWQGTACQECDDSHGGPRCTIACPVVASNGLVCNGPTHGKCNKTTGACTCIDPFCGSYCDSIPEEQCSSCEEPNQYGEDCTGICTCVYGVCDVGRSGTGYCTCHTGRWGSDCTGVCDGGLTTPCSLNGVCRKSDGKCDCYDGFAGNNCEIECLGGRTCSGHGKCDGGRTGTGVCTCDPGYVWSHTGCDTRCECNGHGQCIFPSDICTCTDPLRYFGDRCQRCRDGYWNGTTCDSVCVNGVTDGYSCKCNLGWGGPACDMLCPSTARGPCDNNGVCSPVTGVCVCNTGWVGPICTCNTTTCRKQNPYTVCDEVSAKCICETNRAGANCEECIFGHYSQSCGLRCECNGNGPCDIDTGLCKCYADDVHGHWSGATCSLCRDGYMGAGCRQKSNAISTLSTLRLGSVGDVQQLYSFFDEKRGIVYAGGNPLNAAFNVSSVLPTLMVGMHIQNDTKGGRVCGDIGGASLITINGEERMLYLVQPNVTCRETVASYTAPIGTFANLTLFAKNAFYNEYATESLTRQMSHFFHERSTNTICAIIDGTAIEQLCYKLQTGNRMEPTFANPQLKARSVRAAALAQRQGLIYVAGSDENNLCALLEVPTTAIPADIMSQPYRMSLFRLQFNNATCPVVDSLYEVGNLILFTVVQDAMYLSAVDKRTRQFYPPINVGAAAQRTNGIVYDPESRIGIAVFRNRVMKFTLNETTRVINAYGQIYITSSLISRLILHQSIQVVYAPLGTARGIEILRFMLLEVLTIQPAFAERIGGTVITVTGRGFRNVPQLQCKIGDVLVKAIYVSNTTLKCVAPVVLSTKACVTDFVEVSTTSIVYTQNKIGLERPDSPALEKATPSYARVGLPVMVTLSGRGMIRTPFATCRFSDEGIPPFFSPATYNATSGTYSCISPNATAPWSPQSRVQLSLDGQVYGNYFLSFLIVGSASGISVVPSSLSAISDVQTGLTPHISVFVIDERGNVLGEVDNVMRNVTILSPLAALNTEGVTVKGICELADYTLVLARAGVWTAQAIVDQWTASFVITVRFGPMMHLRVRTQPLQLGDIIVPNLAIPRQTEVEGVDAAGNVVYDSFGLIVNASLVALNATTGELMLFDNETKSLGQTAFSNNGIATLAQLVVTPLFGTEFTLFFTLRDNANINVTSMKFFPSCPPDMFFVPGMRECISCPTGQAVCNGSDYLKALPGYWRASPQSLTFYECPRPEVCLGGSHGGCARGYRGALCAVCDDDFGLGYRGTCDSCDVIGVDITIILVLLIGVFALLTFCVLIVVQNYSVPGSLIGRTITTGLIVLCYLQTVTLLGLLDLDAAEPFTAGLSLIAVVADFRFYGLHATACILSRAGLNLQHMSLTYTVAFFVLQVTVTFTVKGILRLRPNILMSEEAVESRASRLDMREAISTLRARTMLNSVAVAQREAELKNNRKLRRKEAKEKVTTIADLEQYAVEVKEHSIKSLLMTSTQLCILFLFQSVALTTFRLFDCIDITSHSGTTPYLRNDMRVACDSIAYKSYHGVATFIVCVIAIALPSSVVFGIALARRHLQTESYMLWTSTLTYGLREQAFFFQGVVMIRRVLCICAIVFANHPIDAYIVVWVLTGSVAVQAFIQPYTLPEHNRYESIATASVVVAGNLSLLYRVVSGEEWNKLLTAVLLMIVISTIIYLFYALLHDIVIHFHRRMQNVRIERMDFNTGMEVVVPRSADGDLKLEDDGDIDVEMKARKVDESVMLQSPKQPKQPAKSHHDGPSFSTGFGFDRLSSRFTRTQVKRKGNVPMGGSNGVDATRDKGKALRVEELQTDGGDQNDMDDGTNSLGGTWYQRKRLERQVSLDGVLREKNTRSRSMEDVTKEDFEPLSNVNAADNEDSPYHDQQRIYGQESGGGGGGDGVALASLHHRDSRGGEERGTEGDPLSSEKTKAPKKKKRSEDISLAPPVEDLNLFPIPLAEQELSPIPLARMRRDDTNSDFNLPPEEEIGGDTRSKRRSAGSRKEEGGATKKSVSIKPRTLSAATVSTDVVDEVRSTNAATAAETVAIPPKKKPSLAEQRAMLRSHFAKRQQKQDAVFLGDDNL